MYSVLFQMTCKICGSETPFGTGNFKHRKNSYCSHACIKKANYIRHKLVYDKASTEWAKNNPEDRAKISSRYYKKNKDYYTAYSSIRKRACKQATPKWANLDDILDVYKEASYMGLEVDHIIPLKHPLVCGLHVWENLQLLSRSQNARKSNSYDILALLKETE